MIMCVSCIFFVIKSDEKEMNKKRMCVCVVFYLFNYLCCLVKKKNVKLKNVRCFVMEK